MPNQRSSRGRVVRSSRRSSPAAMLSRLVYALMSIIIVILTFRFILRLFGANPEAQFVDFVYRISAPFMVPFEAVFSTTSFDQAVFEWNTLLAMAVYAVIAWAMNAVLLSVTSGSRTEVVEEVHEVDSSRRDDL